ncbi:hypothetical protein ACFQ5J_12540 [Lacticaseibacillus baoqingensis]|uniref:Uncharacterized protein n=1 Tax=Lacticaseibacillus baoqingensis TaxID=2486013 RepID=A0ABW4E818_9LACO|nr:hypothetical protein [Lacticaseibacillus baoqingensis]
MTTKIDMLQDDNWFQHLNPETDYALYRGGVLLGRLAPDQPINYKMRTIS